MFLIYGVLNMNDIIACILTQYTVVSSVLI
jgi:hypothetical protein